MWIMTEESDLINMDPVNTVLWTATHRNNSTGSFEYDLRAWIGERYLNILNDVEADAFEREAIIMRLWSAVQQGGIFKAVDLYRRESN